MPHENGKSFAARGSPGLLVIGDYEYTVPPPTPGDLARTHDAMREIAQKSCVSPLAFVNAAADTLSPLVLSESVRAAVAMGSGGGVEPTREAILRAYDSLEGVRWQFWYVAKKSDPAVTRGRAAELVTEENRYDVSDALAVATGLRKLDEGKGPPGSGGNSSPPSPGTS